MNGRMGEWQLQRMCWPLQVIPASRSPGQPSNVVKDSTGVEERRQTAGVSREKAEMKGDKMTRKKEETKKEIKKQTEKYG